MKWLKLFENFDVEKFEEISMGRGIELHGTKIEMSNDTKKKINNISKLQTSEYAGGVMIGSIYKGAIIYELPDEWFVVFIMGKHYKCDQFEGLVDLLKKHDFA